MAGACRQDDVVGAALLRMKRGNVLINVQIFRGADGDYINVTVD